MRGLDQVIERMRQTGRSMAKSSFVTEDTIARLPKLSPEELDQLSFGCVQVDEQGKILQFNRYESELSGLAPSSVIGKNYFTQVAPCTNNDIFYGTFKKGVQERDLNSLFLYTFTYKMAPTNVKVHLYRDNASQTNWIMVQKR